MVDVIKDRRSDALRILSRHGAHNPRIFGSIARGDARPSSDIDVLVEMDSERTLVDLVALEQDLTALFGRPVDVITDGGISPHLRDRILAEAIPL
jgi:predicted nucleotidyltransferase